MHILDSDTLTHVYQGHARALQRVQEIPEDEMSTTVFSYIEVLRGRFEFMLKASSGAELLRAQTLLTRSEEFLAEIDIIPFGEAAAAVFDRLRTTKGLRKIG